MDALSALHFLRPHWLWALLALPLLWLAWSRRARRRHAWRDAVDAHLLPHLLQKHASASARAGAVALAVAYALSVLALAGPSWRQSAQPLWRPDMPLVVALDLSSTTLAADVPPSRLAVARSKLDTLLRERRGGPVGLVVFAGDAFTVAPLTEDAANVALFLDALAPDVMPVDGQRADRAIEWSARLLRRAGFERGRILVLTDHADADAITAAERASADGYRIDVLGLGSAAGAPFRRGDGRLVAARRDDASLRALARAGGGSYEPASGDSADLRALGVFDATSLAGAQADDERGRTWRDEGYWLLLPLLLLALPAFRRRGAVAVLALALVLPTLPAQADEWWRRDDQAAHARLSEGTRAYRGKDYAEAARLYGSVDDADADYNRGNALARAGHYPQAIAAYDEALRRQPGMADAIANKRAVEAAMKRRPPQGGGDDQSKPRSGQTPQPGQSGAADPAQSSSTPSQPSPQPGASKPPPSQPPQAADAQAQAAADRAQRERIERALEQQKQGGREAHSPASRETAAQRERRLANQAWLQRVPDDPGGLLRAKFRLEHERRLLQGRPED